MAGKDFEEETYTTIFNSLKHPIRRRILRMLEQNPSTYSDILDELNIESGHLNYHLDQLGSLLTKNDSNYTLSTFGRVALSILMDVEEPVSKSKDRSRFFGSPRKVEALIMILIVASSVLGTTSMYYYNNYVQLNVSYSRLLSDFNELAYRIADVRVDKRIELLSAIVAFTSWKSAALYPSDYKYKDDLLGFFEPYKHHIAINLFEQLKATNEELGLSMPDFIGLMMYLSDPPELKMERPFNAELIEKAGNITRLEEYVEALRSYCLLSEFETFWNTHLPFYYEIENEADKADSFLMDTLSSAVETVEGFLNTQQNSYTPILAPAFQGGFGYRIESNGQFDVYLFNGATSISRDTPVFKGIWYDYIVYCFISSITTEYKDEYTNPLKLLEPLREELPMWYDDWMWLVDLQITTAVTAKLFNREYYLELYEKDKSYTYVQPVFDLLAKYEKSQYGSFHEFYHHEIIDFFNNISEE